MLDFKYTNSIYVKKTGKQKPPDRRSPLDLIFTCPFYAEILPNPDNCSSAAHRPIYLKPFNHFVSIRLKKSADKP